MEDGRGLMRLGVTKAAIPAGTHICHIFSDDEEREAALTAFLLEGLQEGEGVRCFNAGQAEPARLKGLLQEQGLDLDTLKAEERFLTLRTPEVYFKGGRSEGGFDPDQPLGLIARVGEECRKAGRIMRLMGEMSPEVGRIEGGRPMIRYEQGLSLFLQQKRMTIVCQYDAKAFHGAVLMDVLRVHPMMVVRGEVILNPFFEPPKGPLSV